MKTSLPIEKNELEESLIALYLRLNGYFTSGFIIHSSHKGDIKSEVDIVATRFPLNREPKRGVKPCPSLSVPENLIDFIIGEVKNREAEPNFNDSLHDVSNIEYQLRWIGAFTDNEIAIIAKQLLAQLETKKDGFPTVQWPQPEKDKPISAKYQIRMILFDLYPAHKNDARCISGNAAITHIWNCLRTDSKHLECNRRYNYEAWGPIYSPIVKYFKNKKRKEHLGNVDELIQWISDKK